MTGKSFEHRREWVRQGLVFLASQYGIDLLGYAVMGNHLHVILRNRPEVVREWADEDVARRIWNLFPSRLFKRVAARKLDSAEHRAGGGPALLAAGS